jgi:hypothetical protein
MALAGALRSFPRPAVHRRDKERLFGEERLHPADVVRKPSRLDLLVRLRPAHYEISRAHPSPFLESIAQVWTCRRRDVHTFTLRQAVAGLPALVHTPEVNQSEGAGPPHWGAISVSLEGRSSRSGLLLLHRAVRRLHAAFFPGTKFPGYAHFTQSMWIIAATSSISANGLQFCPVDSPANGAQSFPSQEHREVSRASQAGARKTPAFESRAVERRRCPALLRLQLTMRRAMPLPRWYSA